MSQSKLKKAPLKEVIFELFWEGKSDQFGVIYDPGFDLAQGKFFEKVILSYPIHKKVIPDEIPVKFFGKPKHQYWSGELKWPVVQHGAGILAVNDTEVGYIWVNFLKKIQEAIENIYSAYDGNIKFRSAKLQYIDAWDVERNDLITFIEQNLQTPVRGKYSVPGLEKDINIFKTFNIEDKSEIQINISNGINNNNQQSAIFLTTTVFKNYPFPKDEIFNWLEFAHSITSNLFKSILKPEFYANLDA